MGKPTLESKHAFRRCAAGAVVLGAAWAASGLAACGDDTNAVETDAGEDGVRSDAIDRGDDRAAAPDVEGDAVDDGEADAPDAVSDASDASDALDEADAADAAPPCGAVERVSPAASPWAVAIAGGVVYWTEPFTPAIRACPVSGCTTFPPNLSAKANPTLPMGLVPGTGAVFFTDNQCPECGLYEQPLDGGAPTRFGAVAYNGAGAVATASAIFWGNTAGLYRTERGDAGDTQVFAGNLSGAVANGPHSIAIDAANVYFAAGGATLRACPLGQSCVSGGSTTIATATADGQNDVQAIVSDGTSVFFTDGLRYDVGATGKERLSRCPTAGCPAADGGNPPTVLYEGTVSTAPSGNLSQLGIAVDATNVYWGSLTGKILRCAKNATAPCTPTAVVTGARPFGMALDGSCLYWADNGGGGIGQAGIYRVRVP